MFAGVASIVLNSDETMVTGLSSKEGEEVSHKKLFMFISIYWINFVLNNYLFILCIPNHCLQVVFKKPVDLKQNPKVNEWLTCVENEMRTSLATLLASAVKEIQQFNTEKIDSKEYMGWVDKYQVLN